MSSSSELNLYGQASLGVLTAVAINTAHPLWTIKNCIIEKRPIFPPNVVGGPARVRCLYEGYRAMVISDVFQLAMLFYINACLKKEGSSNLLPAMVSGAAASVPIAYAEKIVLLRQRNRISLAAATRQTFRPSSLAASSHEISATMIREMPMAISLFVLPKYIDPYLPIEDETQRAAAAGCISGAVIGALTTPLDMAKTHIQTLGLTFRQGYAKVFLELLGRDRSTRNIPLLVASRVVYIATIMAIASTVDQAAPSRLPSGMRYS